MMEKENIVMEPVLEVGKRYHFFDDGKLSISRLHVATVVRVWDYDELKDTVLEVPDWENEEGEIFMPVRFEDFYRDQIENNSCYMKSTDKVIELSVPTYDKATLLAVRSSWGGWFTLDIESSWQGGMVDTDDSIYQRMKNDLSDTVYKDVDWCEYDL